MLASAAAIVGGLNIGVLGLIIASYVANRQGAFGVEKTLVGLLVVAMAITVFYGVLELRQMQTTCDTHCPPKASK